MNKQYTELLKDIIRNPYAWPGGYERVAIANDGGLLCHQCLKNEYKIILHSTRHQYNDGWEIVGQTLAEEIEGPARCDNCNRTLVEHPDVAEYVLPAHWALALINGDYTGYDDDEIAAIDALCNHLVEEHGHAHIYPRDDEEPYFVTYHDAKKFGVLACDCITYTILPEK